MSCKNSTMSLACHVDIPVAGSCLSARNLRSGKLIQGGADYLFLALLRESMRTVCQLRHFCIHDRHLCLLCGMIHVPAMVPHTSNVCVTHHRILHCTFKKKLLKASIDQPCVQIQPRDPCLEESHLTLKQQLLHYSRQVREERAPQCVHHAVQEGNYPAAQRL